jgi:hypothetical protein
MSKPRPRSGKGVRSQHHGHGHCAEAKLHLPQSVVARACGVDDDSLARIDRRSASHLLPRNSMCLDPVSSPRAIVDHQAFPVFYWCRASAITVPFPVDRDVLCPITRKSKGCLTPNQSTDATLRMGRHCAVDSIHSVSVQKKIGIVVG